MPPFLCDQSLMNLLNWFFSTFNLIAWCQTGHLITGLSISTSHPRYTTTITSDVFGNVIYRFHKHQFSAKIDEICAFSKGSEVDGIFKLFAPDKCHISITVCNQCVSCWITSWLMNKNNWGVPRDNQHGHTAWKEASLQSSGQNMTCLRLWGIQIYHYVWLIIWTTDPQL